MVEHEQAKDNPLSTIVARANLLTEFVEFLENSLPVIVMNLIGLIGVLLIILSLNLSVFFACLAVVALVIVVYIVSGNWNFRFNKGYNDQLEQQVDALSTKNLNIIEKHFSTLMRWNIRLSDLETVNYAIVWIGIIALLVYSPIAVIEAGVLNFGLVFSVLMYVFQFIDSLIGLPLFIQQLIRLQEISSRLRG